MPPDRQGLDRIPAVVRTAEDADALEQALLENLHREDLNAIEEAAACQQLMDEFGFTQETMAKRLGRSRSADSQHGAPLAASRRSQDHG